MWYYRSMNKMLGNIKRNEFNLSAENVFMKVVKVGKSISGRRDSNLAKD